MSSQSMIKQKNLRNSLQKLLIEKEISSQDELRTLLAKEGLNVSQSKLSRLLRKIGVIKIKSGKDKLVYSLPNEPPPPKNVFSLIELVQGITANENLIVVFTNPDSALLIASLIDHNRHELEIMGTLAGADTIFIAPKSIKNIAKVVTSLKNFLALDLDSTRL